MWELVLYGMKGGEKCMTEHTYKVGVTPLQQVCCDPVVTGVTWIVHGELCWLESTLQGGYNVVCQAVPALSCFHVTRCLSLPLLLVTWKRSSLID